MSGESKTAPQGAVLAEASSGLPDDSRVPLLTCTTFCQMRIRSGLCGKALPRAVSEVGCLHCGRRPPAPCVLPAVPVVVHPACCPAGMCLVAAGYPLDLVKVRMIHAASTPCWLTLIRARAQVRLQATSKYKGMVDCFITTVKEEGVRSPPVYHLVAFSSMRSHLVPCAAVGVVSGHGSPASGRRSSVCPELLVLRRGLPLHSTLPRRSARWRPFTCVVRPCRLHGCVPDDCTDPRSFTGATYAVVADLCAVLGVLRADHHGSRRTHKMPATDVHQRGTRHGEVWRRRVEGSEDAVQGGRLEEHLQGHDRHV